VGGGEAQTCEDWERLIFLLCSAYLPYPPSSTLTTLPEQQMSATFRISEVVHAKSSGLKSMPGSASAVPVLVLPTSPSTGSKPVDSRMSEGLKARRAGSRRCVMACRYASRPTLTLLASPTEAAAAPEGGDPAEAEAEACHMGGIGTLMML